MSKTVEVIDNKIIRKRVEVSIHNEFLILHNNYYFTEDITRMTYVIISKFIK